MIDDTLMFEGAKVLEWMRKKRHCVLDDQREALLIEKGLVGRCSHLRPFVVFALNTGLRFTELRMVERDHVNLAAGSIWINESLGVNKTIRRDLLGHEPKDMTEDYTHSSIEERRRAVELLCHNLSENVLDFPVCCGKIVTTA